MYDVIFTELVIRINIVQGLEFHYFSGQKQNNLASALTFNLDFKGEKFILSLGVFKWKRRLDM